MNYLQKIRKLEKFRGTNEWNKLSVNHKQLLDIQINAMRTYMEALIGRCLDIQDKINSANKNDTEVKEGIDEGNGDSHQVNVIILGLGDLNE